jgi:hypothetical protein
VGTPKYNQFYPDIPKLLLTFVITHAPDDDDAKRLSISPLAAVVSLSDFS